MLYASKTPGLRFIVNVILNGEREIIASFAGDLEAAHAKGCDCTLPYREFSAILRSSPMASARATGTCPTQWLSPVRRGETVHLEERGMGRRLHDITIGTGLDLHWR